MKQRFLLFLGCMLVTLGLRAEEVTLSFASTAQRISQDANKQVWANGVITFTNEKASSSTSVANYSNPVRLYQGSSIAVTIESGYEMTKIVFVSDGTAKYKEALQNSLTGAGFTYTNSGNNYTVALTPAATSLKIAKLTAQARFKSLTVTYVATNEDAAPSAPELTSSCKFLEEQVVEISCSTEGAKIYYTMDGNDPTTGSNVYSAPFSVTKTTTIKAIAVKDGASSGVVTATYTNVEAEVSPVGGDSSDDALTIEQGTEITITPAENNTATYSINDAEAITITEATIFNANEVGAMKLAVTSTLGSDSKTATYYYDVVAETPKVTALLTTDEYENQTTPGAYSNTSVNSKTGVWNGNMIVNSTSLQLRAKEGAHIQSPVFPGRVVSVSVVFTETTVTTSARGFVVMPTTFAGASASASTKDCLGSASYKGKDDPTSTVELSNKEINSFKIYATGGAIYMKSIKVVYEKPADHVLKVGSTGWATLYLGLDAKIPNGVNCYAISSVADETAELTAISNVLPAHTGVIVKGEPNTDYTFEYLDEYMGAYGECNMLEGSIVNTYVAGGAYVLAKKDNMGVGFYKVTLNKDAEGKTGTTHFLNNANKAYLPVSALTAEQRSNGFRLHIGGTTSIQNSEFNIQDSAIIYDLQGRRVEKMEKGIYIVNGKKVIVK